MRGAAARLLLLLSVVAAGSGCAARVPGRPSGSPAASPDAVAQFDTLTAHCAGLRTMTAELGLSGHAGDQRMRGRIIAGLERGGSVRLEGVAPFGAPMFILAARRERATLLLPRERRVLDDTPVAEVIERLTGLSLGASDLLQALAGCVGAGEANEGRQWPGGWRAVAVPGNRTVFLREQSGRWQIAAVDAGGWRADYGDVQNGLPRRVRLRSERADVDLTAAVQQLEVNTAIDAAAFELTIPPDAEPMTLDELRSVAPLRMP